MVNSGEDMLDNTKNLAPGAPCPARRTILRGLAVTLPAALLLTPIGRTLAAMEVRPLRLHHLHTGERLSVVYYAEGGYVPESLAAIDHLLRDFRTGEVHPIDRTLLDLLFDVSLRIGRGAVFEVISGYRSAETNAMLRRTSPHVAKRSLHMQGRAVDVRLQGLNTTLLRNAAIGMKRGGVGYYPRSDFVHLDTGRARTW